MQLGAHMDTTCCGLRPCLSKAAPRRLTFTTNSLNDISLPVASSTCKDKETDI